MARNEHDGRSLEERLASLDAMSGETTGPSPAPSEGERQEAPAEQENAPPDEGAQPESQQPPPQQPVSEQTDPNANPWLAAPPSFQQPSETGYPAQTFGPPQPPPYEG
ncbi:hypothetical protein E1285_36420, partial [Actinomadura sp. 7K507]